MTIHYRNARPDDAAACIDLRGRTRENAFSAAQLAELGITEESWAAGIADGDSIGRVAWEGQRMAGYCFADRESGEVLVLALLPEFREPWHRPATAAGRGQPEPRGRPQPPVPGLLGRPALALVWLLSASGLAGDRGDRRGW